MSSYGHSLVPKRGVQVQKLRIGAFFPPKLYLDFLAKNTPKLPKLFKKRHKSSICPIIFRISSKKNPRFNVDLFSQTFDMESP